jgi:hypothetical protein
MLRAIFLNKKEFFRFHVFVEDKFDNLLYLERTYILKNLITQNMGDSYAFLQS